MNGRTDKALDQGTPDRSFADRTMSGGGWSVWPLRRAVPFDQVLAPGSVLKIQRSAYHGKISLIAMKKSTVEMMLKAIVRITPATATRPEGRRRQVSITAVA